MNERGCFKAIAVLGDQPPHNEVLVALHELNLFGSDPKEDQPHI